MSVNLTSIRLDTQLADEAAKVLGVKSRTEAVHVALREIVALKRFKALMKKNEGKLSFANLGEELIILDTSVLVDDLRTGRHRQRIENLGGLVRNSAPHRALARSSPSHDFEAIHRHSSTSVNRARNSSRPSLLSSKPLLLRHISLFDKRTGTTRQGRNLVRACKLGESKLT